MPTINDLRALLGPDAEGRSDQELLNAFSQGNGMTAGATSAMFGHDTTGASKWGNRWSSAIDSYQANMYGVAEALGAGDWARRGRINNEFDAAVARDYAGGLGAVQSFRDIRGVGDALDYAGGLAVDSAPYMAEALAGGFVGRGLSGVGTALKAARAAGDAAEVARLSTIAARAGQAGAVAASYPSAVGDILSNQRDQADTVDLGSAMLGGVPYAALNAFGLEGALARGTLPRAATRLRSAGITALSEGLSETGQEVVNQYGRNAVDPSAGYFGPEALNRYAESFVGGAVLGGLAGPIGSPQRPVDLLQGDRSAPPEAPAPEATPTLGLPWNQRHEPDGGFGSQTPFVVFPDGSTSTNSDVELMQRYGMTPDTLGDIRRQVAPYAPQPPRIDPAMDTGNTAPYLPGRMVADEGGQVALDATGADALYGRDGGDPGLVLARDRYLEQKRQAEQAAARKEQIAAEAAKRAELAARAQEATGVKGTAAVDLFGQLETLRDAGAMSEDEFVIAAALISNRENGKVRKQIAEAQARMQAAPAGQAAAAPTTVAAPNVAPPTVQPVAQPVIQTPVAAPQVVETVDEATGAKKFIAPYVAPKREAPVLSESPQQVQFRRTLAEGIDKLNPEERDLVTRFLGVTTSPTEDGTGVELELGEAESLEAISESQLNTKTGKLGMSREAVRKRLNKALNKIGAPEDVSPQVLYEQLGMQLGGTDLDTLSRMTAQTAPPVDLTVEDQLDGGLAPLVADEATPEAYAEDDVAPAEAVATVEDDLEIDTDLDALLDEDYRAGRVIRDDVAETQIGIERIAGPRAWGTLPAGRKAEAVRVYARARLAGDPEVLNTKRVRYEREQARGLGTPAVAGAEGDVPARAAYAGEQRQGADGVVPGADGAVEQVRAAGGQQPTVTVKRRRSITPPAGDAGATGRRFATARPGTIDGASEDVRPSSYSAVKTMAGASHAIEVMEKFGIPHAVDWVDSWFTSNPRHHGDGGAYYTVGDTRVDAKQAMEWRPTAVDSRYGGALVDFVHEVGHAVDLADFAGGVYSTQPEVAFAWQGEPVAVGPVARELATIYQFMPETTLAEFLEYPLNHDMYADIIDSAGRAQNEVFAQLFAAYHHPSMQRELKKHAPLATKFIEEVIYDLGRTQREAAHNVEVAQRRRTAFESRARPAAGPQQQPGSRSEATGKTGRPDAGRLDRGPGQAPKGPLKSAGSVDLDARSQALNDLQLPGKMRGVKGFFDGIVKDRLYRAHRGLLGWLSAEQLADRFKDLPGVRQFSELTARMSGRASQIMHAADVLKRRWEALGAPEAEALGNLLLDSTQTGLWPDAGFRDEKNLHVEDTPANRAAHAKLAEQYRTAAAPVKQLYQDILADFAKRRDAKIAGMRRGIVATYYPDADNDGKGLTRAEVDRVAAAGKDRADVVAELGTTVRRQRELRSLVRDLNQHADTFATTPGPYFPLMRFGDNVVAIKSAAYVQAEKELVSAQKALEAAENAATDDADVKAERDEVKRATTVLNNFKRSGNDYRVEFFETYGEARQFNEQAKAKLGSGFQVTQSIKDKYLRSVDATSPTFMKRIEQKLGQYFEGEKGDTIKQAVREMYIQMLPENSMLKSQLKRQNVLGASRDAQRSFAASAVRDAHGISRLEYQAPMREALDTLRFDRGDIDAKILGQELAERLQQNFDYQEHPLLSGASNLTYLTRLGLSPSFLVTQLTQPWVVSAPILAARHHMKSFGALREATVAAGKMLHHDAKQQGTMNFSLDPDRALKAGQITQDESLLLKDMLDRGRIDITITQDLGATAQGRDSSWLTKVVRMSALPAQQLEVMNRVATALAAYRLQKQLELSRGVSNPEALERAAKYADQIVSETHLNYAPENRARHMHQNTWGGWGRIVWQFRSYQQGMLFLVIKNMMDAARGDPEARRAAGYLGGMLLASAGTTGLPGAAAIGFIIKALYDALKDEDDERDALQAMYAGIEDAVGTKVADAIVKGLPAALGVDMSGRIGMGTIASVAPYADDRAEGRKLWEAYWLAFAGGAAGGVVADWFEAYKMADEGKFTDAARRVAPKVLSDQVRMAQEATQGRTDTRGRVLVPAEERGLGDALARAMGFSTTDDARMGERRAAFFEARGKRDDVRQGLLTEFAQARLAGEPVTDILEKIAAFNGRHPDAKITPANRESAVRNTRNRAKEMRGGVPVRDRDQELAEDFGI